MRTLLFCELTLFALFGCATDNAPLHMTLEQITDDPNIYRPCDDPGSDCGDGAQCSSLGEGLRAVCLPRTGLGIAETDVADDDCPVLVGPYIQKRLYNVSCVIECESDASDEPRCPIELPHCEVNPFSGAGRYEAPGFCVLPTR